jgi:8-oxo-dGTP pyrophosphatase MutT (NUDIX family)
VSPDPLSVPCASGATLRPTARVLLVDPASRLLLLRAGTTAAGPLFWFVVGGGVEPGEDMRSAAVREVQEETGLERVMIGPEVWRRRLLLVVDGARWDLRERYFLARVPAFTPDCRGLTGWERERVTELRWWSAPELAASTDRMAPADLAARFATLLREGPPLVPDLLDR